MFTGWRRIGSSGLAGAVVVALVLSFLVIVAWNHQGYPAASVELNDDGVWVTNPGRQLVGHVNHTINELDGAVSIEAAKFDVLQDGGLVLVHAESESGLYPVDPATQEPGEKVELPPGSALAIGGGRIASLENDSGKVRVGQTPAELAEGMEPAFEVGAGGKIVVGSDGAVHALSTATRKVETLTAAGERRSFGLPGGSGAAEGLAITAVGGRPVVLDSVGRTLMGDGWTANIGGSGDVVLQQRGAADDAVVYATETELVSQPLGGGTPTVLASAQEQGKPAAPAVVAGCVNGAWASGMPTYTRVCGDDVQDLSEELGQTAPDALVFRVNRNAVVLNNALSGDVYVASKNVRIVDNWEDVIPPDADTDEQDKNSQRNQEQAEQEREDGNRPPIAVDDEFGVRPGRTTTLPVLQNDTDPDGDLLTAKVVGEGPSGAAVTRAAGGLALQIAVPEGAAGEFPFRYEVSDGRGGTAEASVRVTVHPMQENQAPMAREASEVTVAEGKSIDHNALANWIDPDGDALYAKHASTAGAGDEVRLLPNGRLTFRDGGQSTGEKIVTITVSDGQAESSTDLKVHVTPLAEALPVANPDHAMVTVGRTSTVRPLLNDLDPTGDQLRLVKFAETSKLMVNPDFTQGAVEITAQEPGTHYLDYMVANGPGSATGTIRIDAEEARGAEEPPTAADDVGLLPAGGEVLVDVVENDYDPAGGVLVVTSVKAGTGSGLAVGVVNNQVLRISDESGLAAPTTITYEISNGSHTAEGAVNVVPVAAADRLRPPSAEPDEATVRVDDVVTIPVLRNDTHPDGDTMSLESKLVQGVDAGDGNLFVAGDTLRFRAGPDPKTVHAIYNVTDSQGQTDSAQVTIHILARDDEQNSAPKPPSVEARAIAGATTRIVIPTDATDPDGDSVTLDGIEQGPGQGRIGAVSGNIVEYTAMADASGVDTFTYKVRDRVGMAAIGHVTVGIAPANQSNQPPAAIGDSVWVRPDRNLSVPVLLNDSDPDGDAIRLDVDSVDAGGALRAEARGDRVNMVSPHEPGVYSVNYTAVDAKGARATAPVTVRVDPDAPLKAPIGRDDVVDPDEIIGKSRVDVEVLLNDNDPDGSINDLTLSVDGDARVDGGVVSVPVKDTAQIISYRLEDSDGLVGGAFILVPGRAEIGPVLASREPVEVDAGKTIEFELAEHVRTRPGTSPRITEEAKVSAQHADGSPLVVSATKLSFTSDPTFYGETALSFEVTDGSGPDDPSGKKAVLAIPITVRPSNNQPPTLTGAAVEVAAGETTRVDLRALSADPDPGDIDKLSYRVTGGEVAKVRGEVVGSELVLTAEAGAEKGASGAFMVEVADPDGETATSQVEVRVTSSDRPLAVANDDIVADGAVGKQVSVAVLANDSNPFPDKPLKLLSANVQSGGGAAATAGDQVNVTPSAIGTLVVEYRVADATGDADREVTGRIRLTVRDKPDAPSAPRVEEVRNRTAVVSWTPPSNNGAQITSYKVSSEQGFSQECATTTCTLDGLTNGTEYFFTVTAINEVGESDPSPRSAAARPDAKPDTPQPPTMVDGDKQLAISWAAPNNEGTPIRTYTLELSPAGPGGSSMTGLTGTSTTITGLENGVSYKARIQAVNDAPDPSEFSPWSAAATPAAAPDAPSAPTATRASSSINGGVIDLVWSAPATNGADISAYDVLVFKGGSEVDSRRGLAATSSSLQFTGLDQKSEYSFAVIATNRVGPSAQGARSTPVVPYGLPTAPTGVSATFGDGRATVKFTAADGNGAAVSSYKVSGTNGAGATCGGTSCDVTGLANGTNYTFTVVAANAAGEGPASSASAAGSPFGKPKAPSISGKAAGKQTTFTWDSNQNSYKNGRDITSVTVRFDNTTVANNGSVTLGDGYDQNHTLTIEVCASEGGCATSTGSARSGAAPPRTLKISWVPGNTYARQYIATIANFAPTTTIACKAVFDSEYGGTHPFSITTDGNGYGTENTGLESGLDLDSSGDIEAFSCDGVRGTR